ncbi:hypothetical protein CHARACLAT_031293 [Characodon lateralis]|uniref:Uncharacterized protein n=1 Tax=Characodon lateralis TaxID=208331 RepID=A0ABU7DQ40_9TELE|nr:hypothetical protein [Characodon lateralis]
MELVPNRSVKQMLEAAGLGEKRLTFQGSHTSPEEFKDFILSSFPKLRDGGGFKLLKIAGSTRSRQLMVIPCPNSGYTVQYLKIPQSQIGHATIFIRPLQRNLNPNPVSSPLYVLSLDEVLHL